MIGNGLSVSKNQLPLKIPELLRDERIISGKIEYVVDLDLHKTISPCATSLLHQFKQQMTMPMNPMNPKLADDSEYLLSTAARREFGLSRDMMTKLLKCGTLPFATDPLDKRAKWVKRRDVQALAALSLKLHQHQPCDNQAPPENLFILTRGQLMVLLHGFVAYLDVARKLYVDRTLSVFQEMDAVQTLLRKLTTGREAGQSIDETLEELTALPGKPNMRSIIIAEINSRRKRKRK
jgi:hypothetical protein